MIDQNQQLKNLFNNNKNILIVFGDSQLEDSISSALALKNFLQKQGKKVEIVSPDIDKCQKLNFLPEFNEIQDKFSGLKKFILKVNTSKAKIKNLSYDLKDDWLSIYLTPEEGTIRPEDVHTAQTGYKYDLIIIINTSEFEALGQTFFQNTELFYNTPTINFDCQPNNEHFGKLNIVDITSTSSAEIIFRNLEQIGPAFISEDIATCLLAGMIARTGSFKSKNVSPKTLKAAGKLLNLGADREKIIKHLFQTKTISSLKLWGLALANLKNDKESGLVWTVLTENEFMSAGTGIEHLDGLVNEISEGSPEAKNVLIIYEKVSEGNKKISVILRTEKNLDAVRIAQKYQPIGGGNKVKFNYPGNSIIEAEKDITEELIKKIKTIIKNTN